MPHQPSTGIQPPLEQWFWELKRLSSPQEREGLFGEIEKLNPAAATELRRMLSAEDQLGAFLEPPAGTAQPLAGTAPASTCRGTADVTSHSGLGQAEGEDSARTNPSRCGTPRIDVQIGPYQLIELIGEGGMGVVYLARQVKPVRREVALKVIRPGMDSRQVIARFEAERQALAMMDHPNIARVLDAGTTAGGAPFFVMELVRGVPITDYCDQVRMPIRQRLELFRDACAAIQHAHNKGIIHRDIKPTNVLVTEQDGAAVVKVIDFGVAKALTGNLTDKTLYTGVFQMIGTPLYMSPEQASLTTLDVDTRSDVYSLGVLLYELLTGKLPIGREAVEGMSYDRLREHIATTDPPRPSKRLSTLREELEAVARRRNLDAHQLRRSTRGELDWIVMRAIEKDRHRRYQSPRELSDDVARNLTGEAIEACPPDWSYRARKFAKRYRTALAVSVIVLASMSVATIISISQAVRATRASEEADRSLRLAEARMKRLSEILYAEDMRSAMREHLAGNRPTVKRILARNRSSDRNELRGYEWYFLRDLRPVRTEPLFRSNDRLNDLVLTKDNRLVVGDSSDRIACVDRSTGRELATIDAGLETVQALAIGPDGRIIAAGDSGSVHLFRWDASRQAITLERQISLGQHTLLSVAVSPDGATAWVGSDDGRIYRFDPRSGETRGVLKLPGDRAVRDLEFSNDTLLAAYHDAVKGFSFDGSGQQDDVSDAAWMLAPNASMQDVRDIAVSDDGRRIVFAQLMGLVTLAKNGPDPSIEFSQLMPNDVHSVAISPKGEWVAVGDSAGHIQLLPTQTDSGSGFLDGSTSRARRVRSWKAHEGKIERLRFVASRDGGLHLLSVGRDGCLVASRPFERNATSFHSIKTVEEPFPRADAKCDVLWAELLLKTPKLAARLVEVEQPGREIPQHVRTFKAGDGGELVCLLDEKRLVRFAADPSATPQLLWEAPAGFRAQRAAVSVDGTHFALCVLQQHPRRHRVEVYETGRRTPLRSTDSNLANDMDFSPSGGLLAYVWNNDIVLLDVVTGHKRHLLRGHADSIHGLAISPDGTQLASVSSDRQLIVWDLASGKRLWSQQAHQNRATAVCFHPTLPTIATVGADATVRFWASRHEVAEDSVRLVGEFPLDVGACDEIAFSADGRSLFVRHIGRGVTEFRTEIE